jgi:signal transduction histidine kinase
LEQPLRERIEAEAGGPPNFYASVFATWRASWLKLTLVKQFCIAASAVILIGMATIGFWVADRIERGVTHSAASTAALQMDTFVAPLVQELAAAERLSPEALQKLNELLPRVIGTHIASIKVWRPDGTVVYSNWSDLVGRRFELTPNFRGALSGLVMAEFEGRPHEGDSKDRAMAMPMLEVYAPVRDNRSGRIIAIAEYYSIERELATELRQAVTSSWLVVGGVALLMMSALLGIVRAGSRTIEEQRHRLHGQIGELRTLLERNKELSQRVQQAHQRSAAINERVLRRVGADLHDGPAQLLSFGLLLLHTLKAGNDPAPDSEEPERIHSALADALRDIRSISAGLTMPEISAANLAEVIRLAIHGHESRTGTEVESDLSSLDVAASEPIKICVYRFVQEALNNSFKHAKGIGQSVHAHVELSSLAITVSDLGPGLPSDPIVGENSGMGLVGLRDRIEALGGKLEIVSSPNGCSLTARLDLHSAFTMDESHDRQG